MKPATKYFLEAQDFLIKHGYTDEINYFRTLAPFEKQTFDAFIHEYVWVILNAGMKEQVVRGIYNKFWECLDKKGLLTEDGWNPYLIIGHLGKREVIKNIILNGNKWWIELQQVPDKLTYIRTLPWLGGEALGYHLAGNLGIDCVKPDIHLKRIAKRFGYETPLEMCLNIQEEIGRSERLRTIDVIIWRYCNLVGS